MKYKLTWKSEQGGRWRKQYRGKRYYFKRLKGETKETSYVRCLGLWLWKRKLIDEQSKTVFLLNEATGELVPAQFGSWEGGVIKIKLDGGE